jgi:hypothetical protein
MEMTGHSGAPTTYITRGKVPLPTGQEARRLFKSFHIFILRKQETKNIYFLIM